MRYHTQNLNERGDKVAGSMFWHGRAWLYGKQRYDEMMHAEWMFGRHARGFAAYGEMGAGENNSGLTLHVCLPWIFSVYLCFEGVKQCRQPHKTGLAIHSGGFWTYVFTNEDDSRSDDPWYAKNRCWNFPWTLKHHLTEILTHEAPTLAQPIWDDRGKSFMAGWDDRVAAEKTVAVTYPYTYVLKSGTIQRREARVFVDRMTWRARWWPLIPIRKVRTSISINFSEEVGERTGSWKGGCTGCGYDMLPDETPLMCLRRMERERKF